MAVKLIQSCDFGKSCNNAASQYAELIHDNIVYRLDVCDEDIAEFLDVVKDLGFRPTASIVNSKRRDVLVTASGRPFTTADARAWLVEQGLKSGAAQGRVSAEHLELYASNH